MSPDTKAAFTVGNIFSYNQMFTEDGPHIKLGPYQDPDEPEPYLGGIVFPTQEAAELYLRAHPSLPWSVYRLVLPNGWDQDVQSPLPGEDFQRLNCDAFVFPL